MARINVRLECPLCGEQVVDGDAPHAGECPGCSARYEGDGESAPQAVAVALEALGISDVTPDRVALALFTLTAEQARDIGITITSDERDGFYRWWVFLHAGDDPRELVSRLLDAATA